MMTKTELTAAIKLLDDPDKEVYKIVEQKILDEGPQIIPDLVATLRFAVSRDTRARLFLMYTAAAK